MIKISVDIPKVEFAKKMWLNKIATAQRSKSVNQLKKLFAQTVYGWSEKPTMGWSQTKSADSITLYIYATGPASDTWNLVSSGSPAHPIYPKQFGGMLKFQPGYRPSTTPGSIQSRRKYRSGRAIYRGFVAHPGFEPRNFPELIAEEFDRRFADEMQMAMDEAAGM